MSKNAARATISERGRCVRVEKLMAARCICEFASWMAAMPEMLLAPSNWETQPAGTGLVRNEVNSELNFCPNFEGLILGCIDADFCK